MNALQLTAVVCLVLVALVAVVLAGAWIYDRTIHREPIISFARVSARWARAGGHERAENSGQTPGDQQGATVPLKQAILINTLQIILCCLFGLSIAAVYYAGWCATWRP